MKLEDMKVGVFVKCTKPEWDCYGDIFEITDKFSNNKYELTKIKSSNKELLSKSVVTKETLQHNFKLNKSLSAALKPWKKINIEIYNDGKTFAENNGKIAHVGLYHEDKYDEFVGAVEALAKLYGRKSPFDEIEELKEGARAAEEPIEATDVSDEWSTIEKEYGYGDTVKLEERENTAIKTEPFEVDAKELYAKPHSPVDYMDLTPPLEAGCLIKLKEPCESKLKGKWFEVQWHSDVPPTATISVFLEPNKSSYKVFRKEEFDIVRERYHYIWDPELKYQFGDRVVLTQTGFSVKRKSYGTIIDWRQYNNTTYYIVHWDDEVSRFIERKEEMIPEDYLLPVKYE